MVLPKYEGSLPHLIGVGVGAFGVVDGVVQATGFFALQSLAGNQIPHMALFSKSAAKLLQQTAKTCQYLKKNAKKVHFF